MGVDDEGVGGKYLEREDAFDDNGDGSADFNVSLQLEVGISMVLERFGRGCDEGVVVGVVRSSIGLTGEAGED